MRRREQSESAHAATAIGVWALFVAMVVMGIILLATDTPHTMSLARRNLIRLDNAAKEMEKTGDNAHLASVLRSAERTMYRVESLATQADGIVRSTTPEQVAEVRDRVVHTLDSIDATLKDIRDGQLADLIEASTRLANKAAEADLAKLAEAVGNLTKRLDAMHEIRIEL